MALVEDEHAVQQFTAQGADDPFAVCVRFRGLRWILDGALSGVGEDRVEGLGELAAAVGDYREFSMPRAVVVTFRDVGGNKPGSRTAGARGRAKWA
jgi:hypothetical protein